MTSPTPLDFRGTDRFGLIRRLGAGGMGVVYEALDRRRNARVALKTLARVDPEGIYRLKTEFRSIAGVTHPNLVTLYELHAADGLWFITMELVGGKTFREFLIGTADPQEAEAETHAVVAAAERRVPLEADGLPARREVPACQPEQLRRLLAQLVDGVRAIHEAGKLHRDLKPSNVLVTDAGRVVVLDFGIVSDLGRVDAFMEQTGIPYAGTPAYMAPEQFSKVDLTEAADWYAVGVMAFEALAGRSPFTATTLVTLAQEKFTIDGVRPSSVCDAVPQDLDDFCYELTRREPANRPSGAAIAERLQQHEVAVPGPVEVPSPRDAAILVGRERTLSELRAAHALVSNEGPVVVFLRGRSGMGKSAVLQAFLESCNDQPEAVVLAGRCYESESVPFKALDALIDALARYLRRLPPPEIAGLLPRRADALTRMFPTLGRVPALLAAPQSRLAGKDGVEERQLASAALREFAGRLTDRWPVVLAIDDMQWGDLDSAVLLGELLAPPDPPPLLLIVAARSEEQSACLTYLRDPLRRLRRIDVDLPALTESDVAELHRRLQPSAAPLPPDRVARIAADAGGNPFLIREVLEAGADADAGHEAVASMIREKVAELDESSRRLVEIVSLSAKPLALAQACDAAGITGDSQRIVTSLRNARLLRSAGTDERETLETYHDRIRETTAAAIQGERLIDGHRRLVDALTRGGSPDAEHLAFHLEGSGRHEQAADLYATAAQQASRALAFDHAVALYERAIRLRSGRADASLLARLAEALAEAGRSRDAATRFAEAAGQAEPATRRELTRRAAYYFCISGRIDEGKIALGQVLGQFGISLPKTTGAAIASVLISRLRLKLRGLKFRAQRPDDLSADTRERLDSLWAAAIGLGNTEVISGIGFSTRGLLQALDAGDPTRIVRAMCWEACLVAVDDVKSARRLIDRAEEIVKTCETPYLRGMLLLAEAIYTINLHHWRDAIPLFDQAEALWLEHCHGVDWELNTARHFCSWSLFYAGEMAEATRRIALHRREAADRGNLYVIVSMGSFSEPLTLLAAGNPTAAAARRQEVMALWTEQHFGVQHILALTSDVQTALYVGDGQTAIDVSSRWRVKSREHGFDRLAVGRISVDYLAINSLSLAIERGGPTRALIDEAKVPIKRLEKERVPWGTAAAHVGHAAVALAHGDRATAQVHLEQTETGYTSLGMTSFAMAARRLRGRLIGGDRGDQFVSEADAWLRGHGVTDPASFCRLLVHAPLRTRAAQASAD